MYRGAIGIIETIGWIGSVEAADAMAKTAFVDLLGREDVGGGHHAVCVRGDVGSVRAALEAGTSAAERVSSLVGVLLIPRPHDDVGEILGEFSGPQFATPSAEQLEELNVHRLRSLARSQADFPLKGREISRATRDQLLEALRETLESSESDGES